MKLKFLLLLIITITCSPVFSQGEGIVACEKLNVNRIYNDVNYPDVLRVLLTNNDTGSWIYARIDLISLNGDTIASQLSCGCGILAPGASDSIPIAIDPFVLPANFSCYVAIGNTYPACKKLYRSGNAKVNHLTESGIIKLYPNPAQNNITVDLGTTSGTNQSITIVNLQGQRIFAASITTVKTNFDLSSLSPGAYFVQLFNNGVLSKTEKLILE